MRANAVIARGGRSEGSRLWRSGGLVAMALSALFVVDFSAAGAQGEAQLPSVVVPVAPLRILDTREGIGVGGRVAPVGSNSTITLQVAGVGGVPLDATGVLLNLTATQGTQAGFVTVYPTGTQRPNASVLNITPGQDLPNMITASLGGGRLDLFNFTGSVHLVADLAGYLIPADLAPVPAPQLPVIITGERLAAANGEALGSTVTGDLLGTLPLPAGSYGITAEVQFGGAGANGTESTVVCSLAAGDQSTTRSSGGLTHNLDKPILTLQIASTFEADGEATVRCNDSITQPAEWHAVTMTAIEAQSIEQVPLT